MRLAIFAAVLLSVGACAGNYTPVQRLYVGCKSYITVSNTLADFKDAGRLKASTVKKIKKIRAEISPICRRGKEAIDAVNQLEVALSELLTIRSTTNGN